MLILADILDSTVIYNFVVIDVTQFPDYISQLFLIDHMYTIIPTIHVEVKSTPRTTWTPSKSPSPSAPTTYTYIHIYIYNILFDFPSFFVCSRL